jgi:tRNA (adenine37-N6)-methyltransferase
MMIDFQPIGVIRTPFETLADMPIQPAGGEGVKGKIEIFAEYQEGLQDLDGFSHLILLYYLHQSKGFKLQVVPFLDTVKRGLFATRAPKRPNPIGLSVIKLVRVEGNILEIENLDILNGTPLLDIKPYVPEFDKPPVIRTGWLETAKKNVSKKKSDDRFTK